MELVNLAIKNIFVENILLSFFLAPVTLLLLPRGERGVAA